MTRPTISLPSRPAQLARLPPIRLKQQQLPVQPRLVPRVHSGGGSSSSSFVVAAAGIDALGLKGPLQPEHPLATIEVYGILPHGLDATPKHLEFTCKRETINALQMAVHKPELLDGGKGADLLGGKKIVGHFDSGPAVHEPHRVIVVQWCLGWHRSVQVVATGFRFGCTTRRPVAGSSSGGGGDGVKE